MNKGSIRIADGSRNLETVSDNFLDSTIMPEVDTARAMQHENADLHFERKNLGKSDQVERHYTGQGSESIETATRVDSQLDSNDNRMKPNVQTTAEPYLLTDKFSTFRHSNKTHLHLQNYGVPGGKHQTEVVSPEGLQSEDTVQSKLDLRPENESDVNVKLNKMPYVTMEQTLHTGSVNNDNIVMSTQDYVELNEPEQASMKVTDSAIKAAIRISDKPSSHTESIESVKEITTSTPETLTIVQKGDVDVLFLQKANLHNSSQSTNISPFPTPLTKTASTPAQNNFSNTRNDVVYSSTQLLLTSVHDKITTTIPMTLDVGKTTAQASKTMNFIYKLFTVTSSNKNPSTDLASEKSFRSTTTLDSMGKNIGNRDTSVLTTTTLRRTETPKNEILSTPTSTISGADFKTDPDNRDTGRRGNKNRNRDRDNRKSNRRGDRKNKTSAIDGKNPVSIPPERTSTTAVPEKNLQYISQSTSLRNIIALDSPGSLPGNQLSNYPSHGISTTHINEINTNTIGNEGLGTGAEIGIIIASIALFWLILGPLLCIVCRLKMRAKERRNGSHNDDMGTMLVEEMIRLELAKGRDKMYQTSVSDVMEIERLPVTCNGDYENLPNQHAGILPNHSSIMSETQYANVHGELYDSIEKKSSLPCERTEETTFGRIPNSMDIYSECDEGRDTITSISTPMMSRDHSQLTNFTGYRSNGSVSVDSGFDNRCSIKQENSGISMDKSPDKISDILERPLYKGYAPVKLDTSSVDKSVDSSPAFSGYANIRQLHREHESAGSLTNDDTTSVDSTSFDDYNKIALPPYDKGYHSTPKPKINHILDPTKYLICNNHVGSLEKTGNPRNSQTFHGGECKCAFRESEADDNCACRLSSLECILNPDSLSMGSQNDIKQNSNNRCSPADNTRIINTVV